MQEVEKYKLSSRWLHWVHGGAFVLLLITGLFLFVPWFSQAALFGWSRLAHRIGALVFMGAPLIFLVFNLKRSLLFVKEAFVWGKEDIGWFKAAPSYYFGGDPSEMPPQERANTGQKLFWLVAFLGGGVFVITGLIMWGFKGMVSPAIFQWCVLFHDLALISVGGFFVVHFYLSVLHPRMTESLRSMIKGKVSAEYAKSHHGKWYAEVTKGKGAEEKPSR